MSQLPNDEQIPEEVVSDLTEPQSSEKGLVAKQALAWGKLVGQVGDDIGRSLLSFIPRGIEETYDSILKRLPLLGHFFSKKWVDDFFKMILGVTIGKGAADDFGYYVVRPLAFLLGAAFGATLGYSLKTIPSYTGQVGYFMNNLAGQTVAGALLGVGALLIGVQFQAGLSIAILGWFEILVAMGTGALLGFLAKAMMLIAIELVTRANAASARVNSKRAKMLGARLKTETKDQSESLIRHYAKEMIFQMNGPQLDEVIEQFFKDNFNKICEGPFNKIERHLNYLTDRAIHGDIQSLKRLYRMYRKSPEERQLRITEMLERVINRPKDIMKLKDEVDSMFDKWKYRHLYNEDEILFN